VDCAATGHTIHLTASSLYPSGLSYDTLSPYFHGKGKSL
jgi:hypothetical protein